MLFDLLFITGIARLVESCILDLIRKILLCYIMSRIAVGIFVSGSMSQFFRPFVVGILQMNRNRRVNLTYTFSCRRDCQHRGIALRCRCHIQDRLG